MLHLGAEVPYPCAVEVLDLCQRGAGNDVAALVELALLLWTVLHLGEGTWRRVNRAESPFADPSTDLCVIALLSLIRET